MSGHDHEQLESAAAWVLGALPDDEADRFAEHLRGCAECRAEVEHLQFVADVLPLAAPHADPPLELRGRIMAVVEREAELLRAAGPAADRPERPARRGWWPWLMARPAVAGGCAAALVAGGIGTGLALNDSGGGGAKAPRTVAAVIAHGGTATFVSTNGQTTLRVAGLREPRAGHVYQVWLKRNAPVPTPDAVFTVDRHGRGSVALRGSLHGVRRVLVTEEPAGGSDFPTTQPILQATPA